MSIEPTTLILIMSAFGSFCLAGGWLAKVLVEKNIHHKPRNGNNVKKVEEDLKEDIESLTQQMTVGFRDNREDFATLRADMAKIKETMVTKVECRSLQHIQDMKSLWDAIDEVKRTMVTTEICRDFRKSYATGA